LPQATEIWRQIGVALTSLGRQGFAVADAVRACQRSTASRSART
jgi:hypothetical protein